MKRIPGIFLLLSFTIISFAQTKTIQERLGYPKDAKLVIIHADDLGVSTYLIIHVAYDNDEMKAVTIDHPDWGSAWRQNDFNFFTSSECVKLLKDNNIVVITWREIRDKISRK